MSKKYGVPLLITNQVGANDDLIFDGRSAAFDEQGRLFARARGFGPNLVMVDLDRRSGEVANDDFTPEAEIWNALVRGVRDYARKTGFRQMLLGLSGGIDSALTAATAAETMGPENVLGRADAIGIFERRERHRLRALAGNLGIRSLKLPLSGVMQSYNEALAGAFPAWRRTHSPRMAMAVVCSTPASCVFRARAISRSNCTVRSRV